MTRGFASVGENQGLTRPGLRAVRRRRRRQRAGPLRLAVNFAGPPASPTTLSINFRLSLLLPTVPLRIPTTCNTGVNPNPTAQP